MIATYLSELTDFISVNVAKKIKLKFPDNEDSTSFILDHPPVYTGWVPQKQVGEMRLTPCFVAGVSDKNPIEDNGDELQIPVLISCIVYSPGVNMSDGSFELGFDGYIDLINVMDKLTAELLRAQHIGKRLRLDGSVKVGFYEDQFGDYWLGKVEIVLIGPAYPRLGDLGNL